MFKFPKNEAGCVIRHLVTTFVPGIAALNGLYGVALLPSRMVTERLIALQADGKPLSILMNSVFPSDPTFSLGSGVSTIVMSFLRVANILKS